MRRRKSPPSHDSCPLKLSCCRFSAAYMINLTPGGASRLHLSQLIKWNETPCDTKQVAAALTQRGWARSIAFIKLPQSLFFVLFPKQLRLQEKATADLVNSVMSTHTVPLYRFYITESRGLEKRRKTDNRLLLRLKPAKKTHTGGQLNSLVRSHNIDLQIIHPKRSIILTD